MRITSVAAPVTSALALVLTLGADPQTAEAGQVCNRLDLPDNCVRSNDLKARLTLRESGQDGRLQIRDADNATAFNLNGASATVTNLFSNLEDESNGLVKAWAQINADGTIAACWRCNTDPAETRRDAAGQYEVDFTPLATDITGRPRSATVDNIGAGFVPARTITLADRFEDPSSVFVATADLSDAFTDTPFVLIIY
jgi:hypothetical protein